LGNYLWFISSKGFLYKGIIFDMLAAAVIRRYSPFENAKPLILKRRIPLLCLVFTQDGPQKKNDSQKAPMLSLSWNMHTAIL